MEQLPAPLSITITLALMSVYLIFVTSLKYAIADNFVRTRLIMTSFFWFIVLTLSISYWRYTIETLPYTIPAYLAGCAAGYFFGVRTERQKLEMQGLKYYIQHFAHIRVSDVRSLSWWTVVNFYSVAGGLLLINFVGLSTVLFPHTEFLVNVSCVFGAFLLGTIFPYLGHLWSVRKWF